MSQPKYKQVKITSWKKLFRRTYNNIEVWFFHFVRLIFVAPVWRIKATPNSFISTETIVVFFLFIHLMFLKSSYFSLHLRKSCRFQFLHGSLFHLISNFYGCQACADWESSEYWVKSKNVFSMNLSLFFRKYDIV